MNFIRQFKLIALLITAILFMANSMAEEKHDDQLAEAVAAAERQFRMTFTNMRPDFLGESPVPGLYEVLIGDKIIYYSPKAEMLLFGELYTRDGISQTQQRISELQRSKIDNLPLDVAVKIGNGPNKVIEFSDLDCPFCKQWEQFAEQNADKMTRYVFLMPVDQLHPTARAKSVHALCSDKPGVMIGDFLMGRRGTDKLIHCETGVTRLEQHERAARRMGVTGTPTLVINGNVVAGFNRARIETLLTQNEVK